MFGPGFDSLQLHLRGKLISFPLFRVVLAQKEAIVVKFTAFMKRM